MAAAKSKASAQICAIVGSDESEVKRVAKEFAVRMAPTEGGDFASDVIDGMADNADQAATRIHQTIEALLTFPFFGGEKLVWLKNANFLADTPMGRAAAVAEALEKLAETLGGGLPESTRFLLSAIEVDKRRAFYKGLSKLGKVEIFDKVDASKSGWEEAAAALAHERAQARGLQLSGEALELFTLSTGGDRRVLENELEKLDLYLGPERRAVTVQNRARPGAAFPGGDRLRVGQCAGRARPQPVAGPARSAAFPRRIGHRHHARGDHPDGAEPAHRQGPHDPAQALAAATAILFR